MSEEIALTNGVQKDLFHSDSLGILYCQKYFVEGIHHVEVCPL